MKGGILMDCCCKKKVLTCDCCTEGLRKAICENFCPGDYIGLTFIEQGTASIAIGMFKSVKSGVVEVDDLLVDGTTSYVSLCDVNSIEKGITPQDKDKESNSTISVPLDESVSLSE